jgi:hypothetical protein
MAEYEVTGAEEVVATHQIIKVEVDGVPYTFATRGATEISDVDARSFTLRDIEPSISDELEAQDNYIKEINSKFKLDKRIARFGQIALTLNAIGTSTAREIQNNHNVLAESAIGVVALGAIVAGELFIGMQSRKTEEELAVARGDRGRLASLLTHARPPRRPRSTGRSISRNRRSK